MWSRFLTSSVPPRPSSPLKDRRGSEYEGFGGLARRETESKVVTFVEDFATQPGRRNTVCSPCPVLRRAARLKGLQ